MRSAPCPGAPAALTGLALAASLAQAECRRLIAMFVVDGLRPDTVNAVDTRTIERVRKEGADYINSHSIFPTSTRTNAASLVTGLSLASRHRRHQHVRRGRERRRRCGPRGGAQALTPEPSRKIRLIYEPANCYRLPHSYAVRLLLASGKKEPVQKALGHASIKTTDFYKMIADPRSVD